jgi:hypothetical protein
MPVTLPVRVIYLGNFAEQLVLRALGVAMVPSFLRYCLAYGASDEEIRE